MTADGLKRLEPQMDAESAGEETGIDPGLSHVDCDVTFLRLRDPGRGGKLVSALWLRGLALFG